MMRLAHLVGVFAVIPMAAAAYSNAASYLIAEQIIAACDGRPGETKPSAAIERDLTGDGRADFILSHEGITCSGAGPRRSSFCGIQVCAVLIYVRRGALLELETEVLGGGVRIEDGAVPVIRMHGDGGNAVALRLPRDSAAAQSLSASNDGSVGS